MHSKIKESIICQSNFYRLLALRLSVWLCNNCDNFIFILIRFSCLHLGQNSGNLNSSVSSRTLIRVLLLQVGHNTHDCFSINNLPFSLIYLTGIQNSHKCAETFEEAYRSIIGLVLSTGKSLVKF